MGLGLAIAIRSPGTTSGNSVNLAENYGLTVMQGTVASDGTISGNWQFTNLTGSPMDYGTFTTISGQASPVAVPEPATYGVWAGIALFTVAAFRGTRFKYVAK